MNRKVMYLLTILVIFFGMSLPVLANDNILMAKGSIEITLKEGKDNMIKEAGVTLYHIANAINENNNLAYLLTEQLKDCDVLLDDLTDTNLINAITKCNLDNATSHTDFTDQNGIVKFDNLNLGLYLVKQTKGVNGYSNFDSFLVALPKVEDNVWVYDIKAKPKTDIYKVVDITILKKWNSHNKDIPSEVTIELYNDLQLIETVTLNNDNNWTFTFKNLKLSDKYNVKEVNIPKGYTPSYKVDGYSFTVTNTDTLAKTGQIFYPIIIFFVLGISLILVGLITIKSEA